MGHQDNPAGPPARVRRIDGWGFADVDFPVPPRMLAWLRARLEADAPFPRFDAAAWRAPTADDLPDLGPDLSGDGLDRLGHARGQALADTLRLRSATVRYLPSAVARPRDEDALAQLVGAADRHGIKLIPWGGGTSVTGGVNLDADVRPAVAVDLERLSGLLELDAVSGLATFGAGTFGPAVEAALAPHGLTLGHFPQSFELSTVGGWVASHSSGQESFGYGRIADLVAGLRALAPGGRYELGPSPASASGPDLRRLFVGSEGRLGVIARATLRVSEMPAAQRVEAALLPSWAAGLEVARLVARSGLPLSLLRLSDGPETEVALAVGLARRRFETLSRAYLRWRGLGDGAALMLLGAKGQPAEVDLAFERLRALLRPSGAFWLGEGTGRHWRADRFRHPYLRDGLLDLAVASDTLETSAPWSRLPALYRAVREALQAGVGPGERELPVLCHLSHPYPDGASLYFTLFFRCPADGDAAIARWADLKRRANAAIVAAGGALSHHHGIGTFHSPELAREIGEGGHALLHALAAAADPRAILNPHVLLDGQDRLEA
jgi:alkyldihydroxyacetonephosphate synthase